MGDRVKRIGILTGGGDCAGLNAVIRAVVKSAVGKYNIEVWGIENGFRGLVKREIRPLTPSDVSGILPRGGTMLGTTNRDNPFHFPVLEEGRVLYKDMSHVAMENFRKYKLDVLIVVGGDGSLKIALDFWKKGMPVIGVPKTIDNDLEATDLTFGFDTAVLTATEALDKLHTTAESHHRVMVLEVMGRYAGWIALVAGIAGGADIILIPEIPFDFEKICEKIRQREKEGKKFSLVMVAEGAREKGGDMVVQKVVEGSPDPVRLGGIGKYVADKIEKMTEFETRVTVLGHLQRGGSPTPFDRVLATRFGVKAVELAVEGRFGEMVCLKGGEISSVPLDKAVEHIKLVPPDCELVRVARAVGVSFGD
ncbi:MAG: 6-phosphofructokinase [Synergistetes bacterium]|nr:6-phosphofructokinase [Synergistota bacterium]